MIKQYANNLIRIMFNTLNRCIFPIRFSIDKIIPPAKIIRTGLIIITVI